MVERREGSTRLWVRSQGCDGDGKGDKRYQGSGGMSDTRGEAAGR